MHSLPCPRCGSPDTLGTFCKDCLRELHPLVRSIGPGRIILCVACERLKVQGTWKDVGLEKAIAHELQAMLTVADDATVDDVAFDVPEFERKPGIKKTAQLHLVVTGRQEEASEPYDEEYDADLAYEVTICEHCKHRDTMYYEGILQVRNEHAQVRDTIRAYLAQQERKGVHLAKETPVGQAGTDYYLSSHRAVGHLARKLHGEFGGELKVAAQHFSEDKQKGKILYRTNALLELPEYRKGEVIVRDGTHYYVLGISSTVKAENLATGAEESFAYVRGDAVRLPVLHARVASTHPLEILHPRTFEPLRARRSKFAPAELEAGGEVSVAVDGNELFLIPDTRERDVEKRVRKRVSQKRQKNEE